MTAKDGRIARIVAVLFCAIFAFTEAVAGEADQEGAELIPRELLFGPPPQAAPQLSPDGTKIAWLAPNNEGSSNIWVGELTSRPLIGHAVTNDTHRGIYQYQWAGDGKHILFYQDHDGDEKWQLFSVDVSTRQLRDLAPSSNARVQNVLVDPRYPHKILIGWNKRDPEVFDPYEVNLDSGAIRSQDSNPGDVLSWSLDHHFAVRAATAFVAKSGDTVLRIRSGSQWRDLVRWPFTDGVMFGQVNGGSVVAGFTADDGSVFAISNSNSSHSRMIRVNARNAHVSTVAAGDCDVAEDWSGIAGAPDDHRFMTLKNPTTGVPEAVAFECMHRTWYALSPSMSKELKFVELHIPGFPYVINQSGKGDKWVVAALAGDKPIEYFLYNRSAKSVQPLFSEHPDLSGYVLPAPQSLKITARDGLQIPIYLTRPAHPHGRAPLILLPHGGPWYRDHDDFDPIVQLFANRGYAVLQVEYRGSTGFGKEFLNAGNNQYGLKMRDDLIDAVEWTVQQGIVDPKRIGVFGISAGGYLSLRVTEARPDLFRATVDVVGPTDIKFLIDSMPASWHAVKNRWLRRIGDIEHDDALNAKLSPNFEGIRPQGAFLIAQGAHDPRVNRRHADAMVAALRKQGASVTYLVYTDEGHGFVRPENNLDFFARVEAFLASTLGGRAQAWAEQANARVEVH